MNKASIKITIITLVSIAMLAITLLFVDKFLMLFQFDSEIIDHDPVDGYYRTYYDDGTVKTLEYFKGSKKEGIHVYYYPDACVKRVRTYEDGKLNGPSIWFSQNGDSILVEDYSKNNIVKKSIINDSLYYYELQGIDLGLMVFNTNCLACHELNDDSLIIKSLELGYQVDTLRSTDTSFIPLFHSDSLIIDSLQVLSDSLHNFLNSPADTPTQDNLKYLLDILNKKLNEPKNRYIKVRKLRKRTKVS